MIVSRLWTPSIPQWLVLAKETNHPVCTYAAASLNVANWSKEWFHPMVSTNHGQYRFLEVINVEPAFIATGISRVRTVYWQGIAHHPVGSTLQTLKG